MSAIDLSKLAAPFPYEDIEWRVSSAGMGPRGLFCKVLAYITARAIQQRLDEVCGPENWRNEEPRILTINGNSAFACGLSIYFFEKEWITKWDVSEPTQYEAVKGGWSGAMKRAGAQWGIGRYLYHLDEIFAEVAAEKPGSNLSGQWRHGTLPDKVGGGSFFWKAPNLPGWALPKEPEHEISVDQLNALKRAWMAKFAPDTKDPADLRDGFSRFVSSIAGVFPVADTSCWTREALEKCLNRIKETTDPGGVSADVPFEE